MTIHSHDAYFKRLASDPAVAADILRGLLGDAADAIDWATLEPMPTEFIHPTLRSSRADLIFRARTADHVRDAFIFALCEHQSTPDPLMPLRVLIYMVAIWHAWLRDNPGATTLPLIIPLIVYNGPRPWTASPHFQDLFADAPAPLRELLAPYIPDFQILIEDLGRTDDDDITDSHRLAVTLVLLLTLKHGYAEYTKPLIDRLIQLLPAVCHQPGGLEVLQATAYYLLQCTKDTEGVKRLFAALDAETREVIMSLAEQLRTEGREEGREVGHREMLLKFLEQRFGPLRPADIERIQHADPDTYRRWADRLFVAPTLDDLLTH